MSSCLSALVAELGNDGYDAPWVDPPSVATRIQEAMRSAFAEELPRSVKRFEDRITSHPAPSDRPQNGGIRARRQRGRANHSSDTQAPSSGTSVDEGDPPAQRPRTLLPAASASTVDTSVLSSHQNSDPRPVIHRQPQQHLTNGFSSSAGPQNLAWTTHLGQGMRPIVIPMLDRHIGGPPGMAPAGSLWPNDGNPVQQGVQQGLPRTIHHSISYPGGYLAPYPDVFPTEQRPSSSPPLVYPATYQAAPDMQRPNPSYPHWPDMA